MGGGKSEADGNPNVPEGSSADPINLNDIPPVQAPPPAPPPPSEPETYVELYDQREWVRTTIALVLLATLVLLVGGIAVTFMTGTINEDGLKALISGLLSPILGVFGTITGFYYGTRAAEGGGG